MEPLPARLAHVLHDLRRACEVEVAGTGLPDASLVSWANLLRVVPDEGIAVRELADAARISRRTVPPWLRLEQRGWLTVEDLAPRVKLVRLTDAGVETRDRWGAAVRDVEASWSNAVGPPARALRRALEAFVAALELELPHHPMPYGTADPSALGGRAVPAREGPPRIPPHGTDWAPVVRVDPAAVASVPLVALVSQALMAFTIDVEERVGFPFWMASLLSSSMAEGRPVPLADLPPALGVNGNGKNLLERHAIVSVTGAGRHRAAELTSRGRWIRSAFPPAAPAVVAAWRDRYGPEVVDPLLDALAAVDPVLPPGLPDLVVVRFSPGLAFTDASPAPAG